MGKKSKKTGKRAEPESQTNGKPEKKNLADQSLDDFCDNWEDSDSEQEQVTVEAPVSSKAKSKKKDKSAKPDKKKLRKTEESESEESEAEADSDASENEGDEAKAHVKYVNSLKDKDPEFYKFLKENNEELLNFEDSESDAESGDNDDDDEDDDEDGVHKLPDKLEVASDESDFEPDEDSESSIKKKSHGKITVSMVDAWRGELEAQPTAKNIAEVIEAFRAAVATVGSVEDTESAPLKYRVEGGTVFNAVVRLCVVNLFPALKTFLKQSGDEESHFKPEKAKKWKKIEKFVRVYLLELSTILSRITESSVGAVVLKHIHQMIPFFQAYPKGGKQILAKLIKSWSQGEETVRILSVMCIVKLVRGTPLLDIAIKQMYLSYVKNCKFTTPNSLPQISFMRRSLVEMMALDLNLAYYQAFVYIRQQAIHLRNALVNNKKDALQAVYNWQFVHSLELWGALLGQTHTSEIMKPLVYPLVQVVIGTIKLVATPKYFPLRFHCCKVLTNLSATTGTFVPVLPFYLDILTTFNFNKKPKKVSMKPLDFSCIIKLSKSQLGESGFKDAVIDELHGGLLTYLADNSNKIAFPELVTPLQFQLKDFLKRCKGPNYCKKMKQILDKVVANQKFIETRRKPVTFGVGDNQAIQIWEAQVERDGTPLLSMYRQWKKVADTQQLKRHSRKEENNQDYAHIPLLKKNHKKIRMKMDTEPEVKGFLSDDGDDSLDEEEMFLPKEERGKKKQDGQKKESKKRKQSEDSDSEDSDDESEAEQATPSKKKQKKGDAKPKPAAPQTNGTKASSSEDDNDGDEDDAVEDLKLEDLESESDLELEDDFDAGDGGDDSDDDDGPGDDGSDDDDDSDDE